MSHPRIQISIVVNGNINVVTKYAALAATLRRDGHQIRFLSNVEHEDQVMDVSPEMTFVPLFLSSFNDKREFMTLIKNMSNDIELQRLVRYNPELQTAMAKCDSVTFMTLLKRMRSSKDYGSTVIEDLTCNEPDLLIAGHQSEYFGAYARKVLDIPSICLFPEPVPKGSQDHLSMWASYDNAMTSLDMPPLISEFPGRKKFTVSIINQELMGMTSLKLDDDFDPSNLRDVIKSIENESSSPKDKGKSATFRECYGEDDLHRSSKRQLNAVGA